MKRKTRDLFQFIRACVNNTVEDLDNSLTYIHLNKNKALKEVEELEKKLSQVEKYLNLGGIIADRNGKPCKHGDTVKYVNYYYSPNQADWIKEDIIAKLEWRSDLYGFCIVADMHGYNGRLFKNTFEVVKSADFELIEQGEKIDI